MACVKAVLDEILARGDTLYGELNSNADHLCDTINQFWKERDLGFSVAHFGSQIRFNIPADVSMAFFQTPLCKVARTKRRRLLWSAG